MRKGEANKKRIMDTAERMFGENGYISTSVQDILNELGISKGGFYHYFDTKLELLNVICLRNAETYYENGVESVKKSGADNVFKLNEALKLVNELNRGAPALLHAVTSLTLTDGDAVIRRSQREVAMRFVSPLIAEILAQGAAQKQFSVKKPVETAQLVTMLALDVNETAARDIARQYKNPECAIDILELLTTYREAIEKLVNAPYGSIELFDMSDMLNVISGIVSSLEDKDK